MVESPSRDTLQAGYDLAAVEDRDSGFYDLDSLIRKLDPSDRPAEGPLGMSYLVTRPRSAACMTCKARS